MTINEPAKMLPGDVLVALRQARKYTRSVAVFAHLIGWSYDTLRRLEQVKWNTSPKTWLHPWDYVDLEPLLNADMLKRGDEFWLQFETAFAWQALVLRYGEQVYDQKTLRERLLAPVLEEHVIVLVRAIGEREMRKLAESSGEIDDAKLALATERVLSEVVLRLATTGFILTKEMGGPILADTEQTRAMEGLLTAGAGAETPYIRTLRLAYAWAEQGFGRELATPPSDR
jgi:hypothetical protein